MAKNKLIALGIVIVLILLFVAATPFSVKIAVSTAGEIAPDSALRISVKGLGIKTRVRVLKDGQVVKSKDWDSEYFEGQPLAYGSTYKVLATARNWLGKSDSTEVTIVTTSAPTITKIIYRSSTGKTIKPVRSSGRLLLPPSGSIVAVFNQRITSARARIDKRQINGVNISKNRLAITYSKLDPTEKHQISITDITDAYTQSLPQEFILKFWVIRAPKVEFLPVDTSFSSFSLGGRILVKFDRPMKTGTIAPKADFEFDQDWNQAKTLLTIDPTDLSYSSSYRLTIKRAEAKDGGALNKDAVFKFETVAPPATSTTTYRAPQTSQPRTNTNSSSNSSTSTNSAPARRRSTTTTTQDPPSDGGEF